MTSATNARGYLLVDLPNVLSEKGWTQADLARRAGLSRDTVARATDAKPGSRHRGLSASSADAIARALNVRLDALCRGRGPRAGRATTATDDVPQRFDSDRLRQTMADRGRNQTALAREAGVSVPTISGAMRGVRHPQAGTVWRIAQALAIDPAQLYASAPAQPGELRLVAGQTEPAPYPDACEEPETAPAAADAPGPDELLRRLKQARRMLDSLLCWVGDLEAQVATGSSVNASDRTRHGR